MAFFRVPLRVIRDAGATKLCDVLGTAKITDFNEVGLLLNLLQLARRV